MGIPDTGSGHPYVFNVLNTVHRREFLEMLDFRA